MHRAFELAAYPRQHTCLGLELLPLTLGHVFALHSIHSPLVVGGGVLTSDIALACLICSKPHHKALIGMRSFLAKPEAWLVGLLASTRDIEAECAKFQAYYSESMEQPQVKRTITGVDVKQPESTGTPWHWQLLAYLMAELGTTEEQALNMTVVKAWCLSIARREMSGEISLWNQADQEFLDACAAMDREREAAS
jgi:hypothetical protein